MTDPAQQLHALLAGKGLTIAVAESLTAGRVQATIASVSGSSAYFAGGITAYNLDQKVRLLGVDRATAQSCNCVSEDVALQMAVGVKQRFFADIAVATTGYAESFPAAGVEAPFAWVAYALPDSRYEIGRIDVEPGLGRVQVQEAVTLEVLKRLVSLLGG